jgi:hypothetical protein
VPGVRGVRSGTFILIKPGFHLQRSLQDGHHRSIFLAVGLLLGFTVEVLWGFVAQDIQPEQAEKSNAPRLGHSATRSIRPPNPGEARAFREGSG